MSKENFFPSNLIQIENKAFTYRQIHQQFSKTEAGNYLNTHIRWEPRKPKQMTNEKWVDTVGYDANNLEHCRLMYGLTVQFIRYQNESDMPIQFSPEEQTILLLTALTHDWPEGLTGKGDINFELKTKQDEQDELNTIEKPIIDILGNNPAAIKLASSAEDCLGDTSSKLGRAFNSIEAIGYVRTAIISWKELNKTDTNPDLKNSLTILSNNVFLNSIHRLIEYSSDYAFVRKFLYDQKDVISQAFDMDSSCFQLYPEHKQSSYQQSFEIGKTTWQQWTSQQY